MSRFFLIVIYFITCHEEESNHAQIVMIQYICYRGLEGKEEIDDGKGKYSWRKKEKKKRKRNKIARSAQSTMMEKKKINK